MPRRRVGRTVGGLPSPTKSKQMANRHVSPRPSTLLLAGALALSAGACASWFQFATSTETSGSGPIGSNGVTGTVTFVNRSSADICTLQWGYNDRVVHAVQLGTGDSTTFEVENSSGQLILTECGGAYTVYGSQGRVGTPGQRLNPIEASTVALYDAGGMEDRNGEHAIEVNRVPIADWIPTIYAEGMNDRGVANEMLQLTRSHASSRGWSEDFRSAFTGVRDWTIHRNQVSGVVTHRTHTGVVAAQWPDGHCTIQQFGFRGDAAGSGFGATYFHGVGPQWQTPCALLDWLPSQGGVAAIGGSDGGAGTGAAASSASSSSAPAPTGMCTNTCRTSNDNECDDGGPNSLYSICALGTDCNDCGPR